MVLVVAVLSSAAPSAAGVAAEELLDLLFASSQSRRDEAFLRVEEGWEEGLVAPLLEVLRFSRDASLNIAVLDLIGGRTGKSHGADIEAWYGWVWNREIDAWADYARFKSELHRRVDPIFAGYFDADRQTEIRLDEVLWGGVVQDGIPPLRNPSMITAAEADYLEDSNVVFGLAVAGDVRAYPKRILAWHEMFVDTVGGVPVAGVYCTLCGSMVLYETTHNGVPYDLGTSGFLFRSNKLMYDRETQSLWNTLWGRPVIGPLVGRGIQLPLRSVLTTTWGEWRRRHPETRVLSLDTGFVRDYTEGAAYREYFATDRLMFTVPKQDRRLKNKAEVLALRFDAAPGEALAISARFLARNRLHHDRLGEVDLVVVTDRSGANRVYETAGREFVDWDQDRTLVDRAGATWRLDEAGLGSSSGERLARLPAHRAFWFGWVAAYPDTRLVR